MTQQSEEKSTPDFSGNDHSNVGEGFSIPNLRSRSLTTNPTPTLPSSSTTETSYIPTSAAKSHINLSISDIETFAANNLAAAEKIRDKYLAQEDFYRSLVSTTKTKALIVIDAHKAEILSARRELKLYREETEGIVEELRAEVQRKQQQVETMVIDHEEVKHRLLGKEVGSKFHSTVGQHKLKEEIKEAKLAQSDDADKYESVIASYKGEIASLQLMLREKGVEIDTITSSLEATRNDLIVEQEKTERLGIEIGKNSQVHQQAAEHFEKEIETMKSSSLSSNQKVEELKSILEDKLKEIDATEEEKGLAQRKYHAAVSEQFADRCRIQILKGELAAVQDSSSNLSSQLERSEREAAENATNMIKSIEVAKLQLSCIEEKEREVREKESVIADIRDSLESLRIQAEQNDGLKSLVIEKEEMLMDATEAKVRKEAEIADIRQKYDNIGEEAAGKAEELRQTISVLEDRLKNNSDMADAEKSKLLLEIGENRAELSELSALTAVLTTQLDCLRISSSEILEAKDTAESNLTNMESYVAELESRGENAADALEMLSAERAKVAVLAAHALTVKQKVLVREEEIRQVRSQLKEEEERKTKFIHEQASKEAQKEEEALRILANKSEENNRLRKEVEEGIKKAEETQLELKKNLSKLMKAGGEKSELQKMVQQLISEVEVGQTKFRKLQIRLTEEGEENKRVIDELTSKLNTCRGEMQKQLLLKNKAENKLKEIEWVRKEERITQNKNQNKSKKTLRGGANRGGEGKRPAEIAMLKNENEKLKATLKKLQQRGIQGENAVAAVNLSEQLKQKDRERKEVKEGIKMWLKAFEAKNGRSANSDDKEEMLDEYKKLKSLENEVKSLKLRKENELPPSSSSSQEVEALQKQNDQLKHDINVLEEEYKATKLHLKELDEMNHNLSLETEAKEKHYIEDNNKLKTKLHEQIENGDVLLKDEIVGLEKALEESKEEARKAATSEKKLRSQIENGEGLIKRLEEDLSDAREQVPKSSSEEVMELREKIKKLEKDVKNKGKASVAGWDKLAELEEEVERREEAAMKEGVEKGEKKTQMQQKLLKKEIEKLKKVIEEEKNKLEVAMAEKKEVGKELNETKQSVENMNIQLEEMRKKAIEDAAHVGGVKSDHNSLGGGGGGGGGDVSGNNGGGGEDITNIVNRVKKTTKAGTVLWREKKKADCYALYEAEAESVIGELGKSLCRKLREALDASRKQQPAAGAVTLRKAFDSFVKNPPSAAPGVAVPGAGTSGDNKKPSNVSSIDSSAKKKIASLEKKIKNDEIKIGKLEKQIKDAEAKIAASEENAGETKNNKRLQDILEKKHKKILDDLKSKHESSLKNLKRELAKEKEKLTKVESELNDTVRDKKNLEKRSGELVQIEKELEKFKNIASEVDALKAQKKNDDLEIAKLTTDYLEEKGLRKKYYNMMEDMKGKIRVYARCRPMAKYEKEKDCVQVVSFVDDVSLEVKGPRGLKDFSFDGVFSPKNDQKDVYEDTQHLISSAIDGYNVCLFAYGQTGSGKTWTMTGDINSEENSGVTPRAMRQLFADAGELNRKGSVEISLSSYFVELYNDHLVDLYWKLDNPKVKKDPPKLEIKVDAKKMVVIKNAVIKPAESFEELMDLFDKGNKRRHVGATKMNAESSRSHSIFSILITNKDLISNKTSIGKLTLVDLAGSERADKTGATGERLHEAMSINKSLSALGAVISALSGGEKFIPYRDNKLTQLMQDSLGGNAKTLMFVNISPADYNVDETIGSLSYAARVKEIKNSATKQIDSEEVVRLRGIIKRMQAGELVNEDEILGS